jgi:hypothetical protein
MCLQKCNFNNKNKLKNSMLIHNSKKMSDFHFDPENIDQEDPVVKIFASIVIRPFEVKEVEELINPGIKPDNKNRIPGGKTFGAKFQRCVKTDDGKIDLDKTIPVQTWKGPYTSDNARGDFYSLIIIATLELGKIRPINREVYARITMESDMICKDVTIKVEFIC